MGLVANRDKIGVHWNVHTTSESAFIYFPLQIFSSSPLPCFLPQDTDLNGLYWWSSLSSGFQWSLAHEGYQQIKGEEKSDIREIILLPPFFQGYFRKSVSYGYRSFLPTHPFQVVVILPFSHPFKLREVRALNCPRILHYPLYFHSILQYLCNHSFSR